MYFCQAKNWVKDQMKDRVKDQTKDQIKNQIKRNRRPQLEYTTGGWRFFQVLLREAPAGSRYGDTAVGVQQLTYAMGIRQAVCGIWPLLRVCQYWHSIIRNLWPVLFCGAEHHNFRRCCLGRNASGGNTV